MKSTKNIISIAVFSAAGILGGLIKIPSPIGSIALDSLPGYFSAAYIHPGVGAIVGLISHVGSAATGGMPLGWFHLWIGFQMVVWCYIYGVIIRRYDNVLALFLASILAVILNGIVSPLSLVPVGLFDFDTAVKLMPFLLIASAINIGLSSVVLKVLSKIKLRGI